MRGLLLGCLVLLAVGGVAVAGAQSTPPAESAPETKIVVQLESDGDARWTVETRLPLDGPNETRGFRELGGQYVEGDSRRTHSADTFRRIAAQVGEETGREMTIEDLNRSWRIENDTRGTPHGTPAVAGTGVLSMSFTWTNFGVSDGDQVRVGDAFQTEERWLPGLRANQTLVVRAPDNYSITRANVGHTRTTVRWEGPTDFDRTILQATFTSTSGNTTSPDGPTERSLPITLEGLLAVVAAILLALVAYTVARRGAPSDGSPTSVPDDAGGQPAVETARTAADPEPADPFAGVEKDLLSDEERIERHLQTAGGRMKQAEIVDRTGWSNAKVSQVLSKMDEEGRVEKLRIGRENLISLPQEE